MSSTQGVAGRCEFPHAWGKGGLAQIWVEIVSATWRGTFSWPLFFVYLALVQRFSSFPAPTHLDLSHNVYKSVLFFFYSFSRKDWKKQRER